MLLACAAYVFVFLPTGWSQITKGMSRTAVVALLGPPAFDTGDIKGAFWVYGKSPCKEYLNVYFDEKTQQQVEAAIVRQFLGPEDLTYVRTINVTRPSQ